MYILYSIFSFSVLASISMIVFRLWELENGKIPLPARSEISKRFHVFALWEKKMWEAGKTLTLAFLARVLRVTVSWIDKARKMMRRLLVALEEALVKKRVNETHQGAPSFFLKDIAEHKKRMKLKNKL